MNLILLGAPGAGKGTQGALLADRRKIARISTGDLLRSAVRRDTQLGRDAKRFMEAGELVPDALILDLVREVLSGQGPVEEVGGAEAVRRGFLLDGFPRTAAQAEGLDAMLEQLGRPLDAVVVIDVPDEVIVQRISGRRSCGSCGAVYNVYTDPPQQEDTCGACDAAVTQRADDRPETVKRRLEVYREQTEPLIAHYRKKGAAVHVVDGDRPVEQVQDAIESVLES